MNLIKVKTFAFIWTPKKANISVLHVFYMFTLLICCSTDDNPPSYESATDMNHLPTFNECVRLNRPVRRGDFINDQHDSDNESDIAYDRVSCVTCKLTIALISVYIVIVLGTLYLSHVYLVDIKLCYFLLIFMIIMIVFLYVSYYIISNVSINK